MKFNLTERANQAASKIIHERLGTESALKLIEKMMVEAIRICEPKVGIEIGAARYVSVAEVAASREFIELKEAAAQAGFGFAEVNTENRNVTGWSGGSVPYVFVCLWREKPNWLKRWGYSYC